MICAVGINTKQNNQENNNILLGRLEGSRNITRRGFWACFSEKRKKSDGEETLKDHNIFICS